MLGEARLMRACDPHNTGAGVRRQAPELRRGSPLLVSIIDPAKSRSAAITVGIRRQRVKHPARATRRRHAADRLPPHGVHGPGGQPRSEANQPPRRAAVPPEAARVVSSSTEDSFERSSSRVQRLVGAEMFTEATGRPSSPSTAAAIVRSPR